MRTSTRIVGLTATLLAALAFSIPSVAGAGGRDPVLWDLIDAQYSKAYRPTTVVDTGGPANWQTRQPAAGLAGQLDLASIDFTRVKVDPEIVARIPLAGLSSLPTDPNVIGPIGTTLDPAAYHDVMQVDLVLAAPLGELPSDQPIGLAVLRTVTGQTAFNGPGTQFNQASAAERFISGQGLQRLVVDPATGRFAAAPSDTILFLDGDRARFWIPWSSAAGTTALQGHVFVPGSQIADTSTGEPGAASVLTSVDLAGLPTGRLTPQVVRSEARAGTATDPPAATSTSGSGGTSVFPWVLILGFVLLLFAVALYSAPTLMAGPGVAAAPAGDDPRDVEPERPRRRGRGRGRGGATPIDPPQLFAPEPEPPKGPSVLQWVGETRVVGDLLTATGGDAPVETSDASTAPAVPTGGTPVAAPPPLHPPAATPAAPTPVAIAAETPQVVPCEPERIAWTTAQRVCDQARFDAAAAEADAVDAQAELDRLRSEYPPLDWEGTGGLDATMDTGEHVTDLDVRLGGFAERRAGLPLLPPGAERAERSRQQRADARSEYDDYQAKAAPLRDRVRKADEARARATEACAKADAAHAAYDKCTGHWSERAREKSGVQTGGGKSPTPVAPAPKAKTPVTPAPGGTQVRPPVYEPPRVTSPGTSSPVIAPPTPPRGGCTTDRVQETCPRQKFKVGMQLLIEMTGSGLYTSTWKMLAPDFHDWADANGFLGADGSSLEVAGDDVSTLLKQSTWRGLRASIEVLAYVRFEEVTMACERRWPCVNGAYGLPVTTTRKVKGQRYTSTPERLRGTQDLDVINADAMARFLTRVWKPYSDGQLAIERFLANCH